MAPQTIGPYRLMQTLGSGGTGTVYAAFDSRSEETIALKLLSAGATLDPRAARRLAREFEALTDLEHKNVVRVFDTGVFQGYPFLAMELIDGLTLRSYLALDRSAVSSGSSSGGRGRSSPSGRPVSRESGLSGGAGGRDARRADPNEATGDLMGAGRDDTSDPDGSHVASGSSGDWLAHVNDEPDSDELPRSDFADNAGALRALADLADEPDTDGSDDGLMEVDLPSARPFGELSGPSAEILTALNAPERVVRLKDTMLQLCEGLAYVHAHGLIHRDLKPSNVMVDEEGQVRLMDFGLAKFLADDGEVTAEGKMVGTYRYMAPEQVLGEPMDARADLYSLGVILYELLTGRAPYQARTPYELWQKVLETEAPRVRMLNPGADARLARLAHVLLRKDPETRLQTAEEVYEELVW